MAEYVPSLDEVRGAYAARGFREQSQLAGGPHQSIEEWRAEFDRAIEAHDRTERAAAWDEGYEVAMHEASGDYDLAAAKVPTNPYRIERGE